VTRGKKTTSKLKYSRESEIKNCGKSRAFIVENHYLIYYRAGPI
jgi:hypothetical protein